MSQEKRAFDPLQFVEEEEPRRGSDKRFVVNADTLYPVIVAAIEAGAKCSTPDASKYDPLLRRARQDSQALADALAECGTQEVEQTQEVIVGGTLLADGSVAGGKREQRPVRVTLPVLPCEALPSERLLARALVLEIARKWFTNELQHALPARSDGGQWSLELYWPNQPRWKLGIASDVLEELERRL
jgi:hypothetical protein